MSIVVTGATGALGRLVVDALLAEVPAGEIVAVARDKEKAAALAAQGRGGAHRGLQRPRDPHRSLPVRRPCC